MQNQSEKYSVEQESSLLDFLAGKYPQSSKSALKKMISHGSVSVNNKTIRNPAALLGKGDAVSYTRHTMVARSNAPFRLIFEDDSIIIIDKPAGLLTYGEKGTSGTSAYKELKDYLSSAAKARVELYVVHRLDREVSGILMFAKSEEIQEQLKDSWQEFTKKYRALAEGRVQQKSGTMKSWLSDSVDYKVRSGPEREGARLAETTFEIIKLLDRHTFLELQLITGRKNQIRVHLADMGHPVVGDRRYGADARWERRIRLHACYLRIRHQNSGEWLEFHSELPRGFLLLRPEHEKYK